MINVFKESSSDTLVVLTKNVMDYSVKIVGLYVQKTEEKGLKETLKKVKKNVAVTKASKLNGYGEKRYRELKKLLYNFCNDNKKLLKSLRGSKLTEKDFQFYRRKLDESRIDLHDDMKELRKETDEMIKKYCVLSKETIDEVEYDLSRFKENVDELSEISIDTINDIYSLVLASDNSQFSSMCRSVCFRIISETQKIITEYASYPNRLLVFFDKFDK